MKGLVASHCHGEQMAPAFILFVLSVGLGHLASQKGLRPDGKGLGALGPLKGEAAAQLSSRGGAALGEFPLLPLPLVHPLSYSWRLHSLSNPPCCAPSGLPGRGRPHLALQLVKVVHRPPT